MPQLKPRTVNGARVICFVHGALRVLGQRSPLRLAYRARQDLLGRGVNPCDTVGSSAGALKGEPATPEPLGPDEMRNDS